MLNNPIVFWGVPVALTVFSIVFFVHGRKLETVKGREVEGRAEAAVGFAFLAFPTPLVWALCIIMWTQTGGDLSKWPPPEPQIVRECSQTGDVSRCVETKVYPTP